MPLAPNSRILSDFREVPYVPTFSKPRHSRGVPMPAAAFADEVLKSIAKKCAKTSALDAVSEHWSDCVGAALAAKCAPQCVKGGTLFVTAINAQVRQMLSFSQRKILEKISAMEDCAEINKIRFL